MSFKEIAKKNDLKNGEMKSFKIDDKEVLLCRIKDEFFAVGAYCTHYGAPSRKEYLRVILLFVHGIIRGLTLKAENLWNLLQWIPFLNMKLKPKGIPRQ